MTEQDVDSVKSKIRESIRFKMKVAGLTVTSVAKAIGLTKGDVSNMLNASVATSIKRLIKLKDVVDKLVKIRESEIKQLKKKERMI